MLRGEVVTQGDSPQHENVLSSTVLSTVWHGFHSEKVSGAEDNV